MAACDDGAEVVHHQQAADTVGGSCAAPQHYGQNQAVPWHYADVSGRRQRQLKRRRERKRWGTDLRSSSTDNVVKKGSANVDF